MTARFAPGDPVRVRPGAKPGYVRTPDYLKGKPGRIESVLGRYRNPEDLAYGLSGEPERLLYKVASGRTRSGPSTTDLRPSGSTPTSTSTGWSREEKA